MPREIEFVEFVQWIADRQLAACKRARRPARLEGRALPRRRGRCARRRLRRLVRAGCCLARAVVVGAPPDMLNTAGQDWGLAGYNSGRPGAAHGFSPFRDMVEASARYAGAIRLDHVMGLQRLFLVPQGLFRRAKAPTSADAARCPARRWIAQVSQALRCIVIGEDLGTVPEGFRGESAEGVGRLVVSRHAVRARVGRPFQVAGSLHVQCAGHIQHARPCGLRRLALVRRSQAEALDRDRSRRKRRCAMACPRAC